MFTAKSLFQKTNKIPAKIPKNLTRAQEKRIREIIERERRNDGVPRTAQQSIPFQRMFPDGICRVTDSYYSRTIQYQDINYQFGYPNKEDPAEEDDSQK